MSEQKRGCGFRSVGGIYIEGVGYAEPCDRLPYPLELCPTCFSGIKFSRGYQYLKWLDYAGRHESCTCKESCYICNPNAKRYGLLWVGEKFYSTQDFIEEALSIGVSKRIATIPKDLVVGKTKILLAHKKGAVKTHINHLNLEEKREVPAIFYAFVVTKITQIITMEQAKDNEYVNGLRERGITPLIATEINSDNEAQETIPLDEFDEFFRLKVKEKTIEVADNVVVG